MRFAGSEALDMGPADAGNELPADSRQFVTFTVSGRSYGIDIGSVREIIRWTAVTPLPKQPTHARGVLNLRGTIVPVHDLRARFGGPLTEAGENHVIIIAWIGAQTIGILVDAVSDILSVASEGIRSAPASQESHLIAGLVSADQDRMVTILDLPALFAGTDTPARQ
jgi:purine-binding chemotaxis protein CheW